ncbi:MAG: hypothetical protein M3Y74_17325 [Chloroflexota bacterium]|nr:hypothetical protein [Chloroflexota bacterium]
MAKLTRGGFLKKTSAGAVAFGALAALPGAAVAAARPPMTATPETDALTAAPFVVYVRNPAAGEIVMLAGAEEFTYTDRALAARLWQGRGARNGASTHASTSKAR